ncbi:MAG: hypothetical protein AB1486_26855 [Planctomycetota bacterium]
MTEKGVHRLFVATGRHWVGYFILSSEAVYLPEDPKTPYVLLFDTRSWTEIVPAPAPRFGGFTYDVPKLPLTTADALRARRYSSPAQRAGLSALLINPRDPPAETPKRDPRR